ncbi:exodeoxyribonuclease VII large subunit [Neisseriaceae bacterium TC5R-5]|nr:exodeoxyribonuclease VII large subunit [Neisseriaceae bacterium TC5R-5]
MNFNLTGSDVISVSSLNQLARQLLESNLPPMWIGGELSNLTLASSGHGYFSLKDAGAQIRCVMFRHKLAALPFRLCEGMQVELKGLVTLYEARGEFQINVEQMRSAGLGRLYEAFEKLKAQLQAEGLFEQARKRPLPLYPRAIGIVTSLAAAALRDVLSTLQRRMPTIPIILYPTLVQGSEAASQIAAAIQQAAQRKEVDVLILCRGGGSIEDLWSFNEEIVARALAKCPIPTISGIGHETDFTICDFVADVRAATPTAAAELASPSREQLLGQLSTHKQTLERALMRQLGNKTQKLDYLANRLNHPGEKLRHQQVLLNKQQERLQRQLRALFEQRRWKLQLLGKQLQYHRPNMQQSAQTLEKWRLRLQQAQSKRLNHQQQHLSTLAATLEALNPQAVLTRGYAIVQKQNGEVVKAPEQLRQHERVRLQLAAGVAEALIDYPQGGQSQLPF